MYLLVLCANIVDFVRNPFNLDSEFAEFTLFDLLYCGNREIFSHPPGEERLVRMSLL